MKYLKRFISQLGEFWREVARLNAYYLTHLTAISVVWWCGTLFGLPSPFVVWRVIQGLAYAAGVVALTYAKQAGL